VATQGSTAYLTGVDKPTQTTVQLFRPLSVRAYLPYLTGVQTGNVWDREEAARARDHWNGSGRGGEGTHTIPFDTGCLPLNYSSDAGVHGVSHRGGQTHANYGTAFPPIISASVLTVSHRDNSGVNVAYITGRGVCISLHTYPNPQYRLFTPELQWQPRGKTAYLTGGTHTTALPPAILGG
jgi:hypothetical protein